MYCKTAIKANRVDKWYRSPLIYLCKKHDRAIWVEYWYFLRVSSHSYKGHCFYPPKPEYLYTVYFIRGVDNTLTEFDAKAVIDTCRCRLDIPLEWASCVICGINGTWYAHKILSFNHSWQMSWKTTIFIVMGVYCIWLNLNGQTMKYRPSDLLKMLF